MRSIPLLIGLQALSFAYATPAFSNDQVPLVNDVLGKGTQVLASTTVAGTTAVVQITLETACETSILPFSTSIISPISSTLSLSANESIAPVTTPTNSTTASDIFNIPISTGAPASVIGSRPDHPVSRLGITKNGPIETNKFYASFFLGNQTNSVWTHPYSIQWSKGGGNAKSWGLSVAHIDTDQRVYGPNSSANPVEYYINPIGVQSVIFSAAELDSTTVMTTDTLTAFSTNVNLIPSGGSSPGITFPLVQGMGFVTAMYNGLTPFIESGISFQTITPLASPGYGISKYKLLLADGKTWLLYATATNVTGLSLTMVSNTQLRAPGPFWGTIQISKNPGDVASQEKDYDTCAGAYPTSTSISASVDGASGTYTFTWQEAGNGAPLMLFALPHHILSFDTITTGKITTIQLQTTTKGAATAVIADSWTMIEPDLPTGIGFAPWNATTNSSTTALSANAISLLNAAGASDLSQDMSAQSNQNSMYYSGKALSKFASAICAVHDLAHNVSRAEAGLAQLEQAYERFANNTQQYPLVYESAWGGIVSTASYITADSGDDFGNTYYNDHHFHWSYFIHTAAIIGHLDPTWLLSHKDWVNTLVRDAATPTTTDAYFPFSRSFDWYHGHSWAKGLFNSPDGKDQESTSEDTNFAYALKMWGSVTGDAAMEARGDLMLAVLRRSLGCYFLLEDGNANQPAQFVGNRVTGILFENKVDHTTYFGTNIEFIQGIYMLPILPHSAYTRTAPFVTQEWNTYFSDGRVDTVAGGWRGILYSNLALIDPVAAWEWLTGPEFAPEFLDGGASLTWYLALAAGLGGG